MSTFCILCQGDQATLKSDELSCFGQNRSVLADPRDEKIDDLPRAETADRRWQQEPRSRDRGVMCHALIVTVTWQQWLQLGQYYWEFLGSEGSTLLLFDCQNKISRKHKQSNSSRQRPDKCKYKQTNTGQPDAGVALWLRVWGGMSDCWSVEVTVTSWHPCHGHQDVMRTLVTQLIRDQVSCPSVSASAAPGHLGTGASVLPARAFSLIRHLIQTWYWVRDLDWMSLDNVCMAPVTWPLLCPAGGGVSILCVF